MGREIQKKKRRSGRQPIRQSNKPKNPLNPLGNSIIAKNWDKKQTLAQNYRRLGLTARLKAPTGGVEPPRGAQKGAESRTREALAIASTEKSILSEAKVELDADGKIVRILSRTGASSNSAARAGRHGHAPLNDPLNNLDSDSEGENDQEAEDEEDEEWGGIQEDGTETDVVKSLIAEARAPVIKKPRHMSEREAEWLAALVERHGDDYQAMARDHRLNPMQQTAADIRRRVAKMAA